MGLPMRLCAYTHSARMTSTHVLPSPPIARRHRRPPTPTPMAAPVPAPRQRPLWAPAWRLSPCPALPHAPAAIAPHRGTHVGMRMRLCA